MSFIKKYQRFVEEFTATAPARPDVKPDVTEKPETAPSKPSPFRRNKPSTEPGTKASAEDVARMSHAHPTYMEAFKEACLAATANRPLHL